MDGWSFSSAKEGLHGALFYMIEGSAGGSAKEELHKGLHVGRGPRSPIIYD